MSSAVHPPDIIYHVDISAEDSDGDQEAGRPWRDDHEAKTYITERGDVNINLPPQETQLPSVVLGRTITELEGMMYALERSMKPQAPTCCQAGGNLWTSPYRPVPELNALRNTK